MHKREKITEYAKSAAVVFLLAALVCLCFIYMLSYQNRGQYVFTKTMMDTLSGESVKYQYADYLDVSYVSPKFIGFSAKSLGNNIGFHTLGGENGDVYASVFRFYEKLFTEEGTVSPIPAEEGAVLFSELIRGDYIYVVYENDLPKSLIYMMAQETLTQESVSGEYIREVLIVPERQLYSGVILNPMGVQVYTTVHSFYAVARDSAGNYYRYTTDFFPSMPTDVSFNTNLYLTYTTTESYFSYEFAGLMETDDYFDRHGFSEKVTDTTMILAADSGAFLQRTVIASSVFPQSDKTAALLAAFMMNPEKVSSYTEDSGTRFYYDEGRNASISPSGRLEYTAHEDGGLLLADLFEYHIRGGAYDTLDYVGASLMLARSLETTVSGGQTFPYSLYLSGVYYDGAAMRVTFGYAIDGLPMYFDGALDVLSLEYKEGMLKKVVYDLRTVTIFRGTMTAPDMLWDLRAHIADAESKREYAYAYLFREGETNAVVELVGKEQ